RGGEVVLRAELLELLARGGQVGVESALSLRVLERQLLVEQIRLFVQALDLRLPRSELRLQLLVRERRLHLPALSLGVERGEILLQLQVGDVVLEGELLLHLLQIGRRGRDLRGGGLVQRRGLGRPRGLADCDRGEGERARENSMPSSAAEK